MADVGRPGGQYRLDVMTDADPDTPIGVAYLDAADDTAAVEQARKLLAAYDGADYGDLYTHDGTGSAVYYDSINPRGRS